MIFDNLLLPLGDLEYVRTSWDSVNFGLSYVHTLHEIITSNYQFGEVSDIIKYLAGLVLGTVQLYNWYTKSTTWLNKRKDEKKINQMIQKLSDSNKK